MSWRDKAVIGQPPSAREKERVAGQPWNVTRLATWDPLGRKRPDGGVVQSPEFMGVGPEAGRQWPPPDTRTRTISPRQFGWLLHHGANEGMINAEKLS